MVDRYPQGGLRRGRVHRLPAGLRYPLGIHPGRPVRCLNSRGFQASRVDPGLRWLPKKSALSLAMFRAKPASIRFGPKRNRKTKTWRPGPLLDPGSQPRCQPWDQRRFARAHDPEYIGMDSVSGAIRLAVRCLARNCLTRPSSLDRLIEQLAPRRIPSTASSALASRSTATRSPPPRTASAGLRWHG